MENQASQQHQISSYSGKWIRQETGHDNIYRKRKINDKKYLSIIKIKEFLTMVLVQRAGVLKHFWPSSQEKDRFIHMIKYFAYHYNHFWRGY